MSLQERLERGGERAAATEATVVAAFLLAFSAASFMGPCRRCAKEAPESARRKCTRTHEAKFRMAWGLRDLNKKEAI